MTDPDLWCGHLDDSTRRRLADQACVVESGEGIDHADREALYGPAEAVRERLVGGHLGGVNVWIAIILAMPLTAEQYDLIMKDKPYTSLSLEQCCFLLQVLLPLDDLELYAKMRRAIERAFWSLNDFLTLSSGVLAKLHPLLKDAHLALQYYECDSYLYFQWIFCAQSWKIAALHYGCQECVEWCEAARTAQQTGVHIPPGIVAAMMVQLRDDAPSIMQEATVLWDSLCSNRTDTIDMFIEGRVLQTFQESPYEFTQGKYIMEALCDIDSPASKDTAIDSLCYLCTTLFSAQEHQEELVERIITFFSRLPKKLDLLIQWMCTVNGTDELISALHRASTRHLVQEADQAEEPTSDEEDLKAFYRREHPLSPETATTILRYSLDGKLNVEYGRLIEVLKNDAAGRETLTERQFLHNRFKWGTVEEINTLLDLGGADDLNTECSYWNDVLARQEPQVVQILLDRDCSLTQFERHANPLHVLCKHLKRDAQGALEKDKIIRCAEMIFQPRHLGTCGERDENPLHVACSFNNLAMVEYLLARPEARTLVLQEDARGNIPLYACFGKRHKQHMLNESGADMVLVTKKMLEATPEEALGMNLHEKSAYHTAMKNPYVIDAVIDKMKPEDTMLVQGDGCTPICSLVSEWWYAREDGKWGISTSTQQSDTVLFGLVRRLLDLGGGKQLTAGRDRCLALHMACSFPRVDIAVQLVELFMEYADMTDPGDRFYSALRVRNREEEEKLWVTLIKHQIVSLEQFRNLDKVAELPVESCASLKDRVEQEVGLMQSKSAQSFLGKRERL